MDSLFDHWTGGRAAQRCSLLHVPSSCGSDSRCFAPSAGALLIRRQRRFSDFRRRFDPSSWSDSLGHEISSLEEEKSEEARILVDWHCRLASIEFLQRLEAELD